MTLLSTAGAVLCLIFLSSAMGKMGFDASTPVSYEKFKCLKEKGFEFFIARVHRSVGDVDQTGVKNIVNAKNAKWTDVGGYIFPCLSASCHPPEEQVTRTIHFLGANEAQENGTYKVGIYTNEHNWKTIVGLDWDQLSYLPLWWAKFNDKPGFEEFKPFGGWKKPLIHQYKGDFLGPCDVEMDLNYKE